MDTQTDTAQSPRRVFYLPSLLSRWGRRGAQKAHPVQQTKRWVWGGGGWTAAGRLWVSSQHQTVGPIGMLSAQEPREPAGGREDGERRGLTVRSGGKPSSVISFSSKYPWDAYVPGTMLIIQGYSGSKINPWGKCRQHSA